MEFRLMDPRGRARARVLKKLRTPSWVNKVKKIINRQVIKRNNEAELPMTS